MITFWSKKYAIAYFYHILVILLLLIYCMYIIYNNLTKKGFYIDFYDRKLETKFLNSSIWQLLVYNYVQKLEQIQVNCLKLMLNNISK